MKTLKEFREFITEKKEAKGPIDPPNVLMMKRKTVRQFPNGQRVALYYVEKLDKYVTLPYTAMQWSITVPPEFK